jgi:hypothetical protein
MFAYCMKSCGFCSYCFLQWCEVSDPPERPSDVGGQCDCYEEGPDVSEGAELSLHEAAKVTIQTKIFGVAAAEDLEAMKANLSYLLRSRVAAPPPGQTQNAIWLAGAPVQQAPLVQQHWRSGELATRVAFELPSFQINTNGVGSTSALLVRQYCYCGGSLHCSATNRSHRSLKWVTLPLGGDGVELANNDGVRRLGELASGAAASNKGQSVSSLIGAVRPFEFSARRLEEESRQSIYVVWGLTVRDLGPFELFVQTQEEQMWTFDPMFKPADPWAQRSLMAMCDMVPEELLVVEGEIRVWL